MSAQALSSASIEGIARVVRLDASHAWLEPEQTTSCGHCASAASCGAGATGMGTVASRLEARRFMLTVPAGWRLAVGERVVVGVSPHALLKAALTAYGLPLAAALACGALANALDAGDLDTLITMLAGLAAGIGLARLAAGRLAAAGELAPRLLRRALPGESCGGAAP